MGFLGFTRKKRPIIINEIHNTYTNQSTATAIVAPAPVVAPRLPSCRSCYSAQRTQLSVTQRGANTGREYYVCVGCPAEGARGRSWIVWKDQLVS